MSIAFTPLPGCCFPSEPVKSRWLASLEWYLSSLMQKFFCMGDFLLSGRKKKSAGVFAEIFAE